jgi:acyl-CoA thioesterase
MDYQKLKDFRNSKNCFCSRLGILLEDVTQGYARVVKTVGPEDLNPIGMPHGGLYFSMADTACGSAMASHGYYAVTVNASYNFLRSADIGDVLTAEAREVKAGQTLSVFDVRIVNQNGILLGNGTFTFYRMERKLEL